MTTFEIIACAILLVTLAVAAETRFRLAAILREVRSEGREAQASISTITELERAQVQAEREMAQGRPQVAVATLQQAEALAKPHRPIWRWSSSEKTNGEDVAFYRCTVGDCKDVLRVGPDDPVPTDRDQD